MSRLRSSGSRRAGDRLRRHRTRPGSPGRVIAWSPEDSLAPAPPCGACDRPDRRGGSRAARRNQGSHSTRRMTDLYRERRAGAATASQLLSGGMIRGAHCRLTPQAQQSRQDCPNGDEAAAVTSRFGLGSRDCAARLRGPQARRGAHVPMPSPGVGRTARRFCVSVEAAPVV